MKLFFSLLFVLSVCILAASAQKTAPPPPPPAPLIYNAPEKSDLKEFVPEDKTFQITFPGVPTISKQEITNGNAASYRVYRQGSNSIVNTIDYDFELGNAERIYEVVKSNLLKLPKTTIEAERNIKIDEIDGKEFDVLQDYQFQKVRVLIVEKRIYEIKSDVTNWHILSKYNKNKVVDFENETERFFASFKHHKLPETTLIPTPSNFLGDVSDTNYKNTFFGFTLDFPSSWHRSKEGEIETGRKMGLELLKTDKEKINKAFEESVKKEVIILSIADRTSATTGGTNLGIGILKQPSSQITADKIAIVSKNFFLTNPKFKLVEDIKQIEMKGVQFSTFTIQSEFNGIVVNQKLFITIRKGYSINFVFTYFETEGLKSLESIFKTLKFDKK